MINFDLSVPDHSYFFGFVQADGWMWEGKGNKGTLSIELNRRDRWILERFSDLVPVSSTIRERTRSTNFKQTAHSVVWSLFDMEFRRHLKCLGFRPGLKPTLGVPSGIVPVDYLRGLIDADGSVGITATGLPFICLTTTSDTIADFFLNFIREATNRKPVVRRNSRDSIYNIMITREDAQALISKIYYDKALALPRKVKKAAEAMLWKRPEGQQRITRKTWTPEEDTIVLTHDTQISSEMLNRTCQSIKMRFWRLNSRKKT